MNISSVVTKTITMLLAYNSIVSGITLNTLGGSNRRQILVDRHWNGGTGEGIYSTN